MTEIYSEWTISNDDQWRDEILTDHKYQWQPAPIDSEIIKQWVSVAASYNWETINNI